MMPTARPRQAVALLALLTLVVTVGGNGLAQARAPRYRIEWHHCAGRAPAETTCTLRTRFRGGHGGPFTQTPRLELFGEPHKSDPGANAPRGVNLPAPIGGVRPDRLLGDMTVLVTGDHGGRLAVSGEFRHDRGSWAIDDEEPFTRWERLTVAVAVSGIADGAPPVGPWYMRIGIPIPIR